MDSQPPHCSSNDGTTPELRSTPVLGTVSTSSQPGVTGQSSPYPVVNPFSTNQNYGWRMPMSASCELPNQPQPLTATTTTTTSMMANPPIAFSAQLPDSLSSSPTQQHRTCAFVHTPYAILGGTASASPEAPYADPTPTQESPLSTPQPFPSSASYTGLYHHHRACPQLAQDPRLVMPKAATYSHFPGEMLPPPRYSLSSQVSSNSSGGGGCGGGLGGFGRVGHATSVPGSANSCELCNVPCSDAEHLEVHYMGKLHKRRLNNLIRRSVLISGIPLSVPKELLQLFFTGLSIDQGARVPPNAILEQSSNPVPSLVVTFVHVVDADRALSFAGRPLLGHPVQIRPTQRPWRCEVCQLNLNSAMQYDQHLASRTHGTRLNVFLEESTVDVSGFPPSITSVDVAAYFHGFPIVPNGIVLAPVLSNNETINNASSSSSSSWAPNPDLPVGVRCQVTFDHPDTAQRVLRTFQGARFFGRPVHVVPFWRQPNSAETSTSTSSSRAWRAPDLNKGRK